jgi:hypothetical protein
MYFIPIGGVYVVLGIQRLRTLGIISTNYNDSLMRFKFEGIRYEINGLKYTLSHMIKLHRIEKILRKGCSRVITIIYSMEVRQGDTNIPLELKCTLEKHHRIFQEITKGIPPYRDCEHQIEIILGSTPPNKIPYRYPYQQKSEIEKMAQDMLDVGNI